MPTTATSFSDSDALFFVIPDERAARLCGKLFYLLGRVLEVRNQIRAIFRLLETREHHLRARDVLFRVQEVIVQRGFVPGDALVLVRRAVRETLSGSGDASEQTPEVRALLVSAALLRDVALRALGLKNLRACVDEKRVRAREQKGQSLSHQLEHYHSFILYHPTEGFDRARSRRDATMETRGEREIRARMMRRTLGGVSGRSFAETGHFARSCLPRSTDRTTSRPSLAPHTKF